MSQAEENLNDVSITEEFLATSFHDEEENFKSQSDKGNESPATQETDLTKTLSLVSSTPSSPAGPRT